MTDLEADKRIERNDRMIKQFDKRIDRINKMKQRFIDDTVAMKAYKVRLLEEAELNADVSHH